MAWYEGEARLVGTWSFARRSKEPTLKAHDEMGNGQQFIFYHTCILEFLIPTTQESSTTNHRYIYTHTHIHTHPTRSYTLDIFPTLLERLPQAASHFLPRQLCLLPRCNLRQREAERQRPDPAEMTGCQSTVCARFWSNPSWSKKSSDPTFILIYLCYVASVSSAIWRFNQSSPLLCNPSIHYLNLARSEPRLDRSVWKPPVKWIVYTLSSFIWRGVHCGHLGYHYFG